MYQPSPPRTAPARESQRPNGSAVVQNQRPEHRLQSKLAQLGQQSPQASQLRSLQALASRHEAPVQRQVLVRKNPALKFYASPVSGRAEVDGAAAELNHAAAKGAGTAQSITYDYLSQGGKSGRYVKQLTDAGVSTRHAENFMNRLIEVRMNKPAAKKLAVMAAGYIAESFANKAARNLGLNMQVRLGDSRPDFALATGETWRYDGQTYAADALLDVTSEAAAAQGHISGKLVNLPSTMMAHYPHLRDISYSSIRIGDSSGIRKVRSENDPRVRARMRLHALRAEMARNRRGSLRSATKQAK